MMKNSRRIIRPGNCQIRQTNKKEETNECQHYGKFL